MSDGRSEKTDVKSGGKPVTAGENFLHSLAADLIAKNVLPWIFGLVKMDTENRRDEAKKKPGNKQTFAEAMQKLYDSQPTHRDFEVIREFLSGVNPGCLATNEDREDFQVNAARTGPTVEDTLKFLKVLAALPDHKARKKLLDDLGYIGKRAVDLGEWAQAQLQDLKTALQAMPGNTADWTNRQVTEAISQIDRALTAVNTQETAKAFRRRGKTALRKAMQNWRSR